MQKCSRKDLLFCFFKMFRSILLLCATILSNTCKSAENCYISLYFIFNDGVVRLYTRFAGSKNTMLRSHIKTMNKVQSVVKMIEATLADTHTCTLTYPHFSGENNACERIHEKDSEDLSALFNKCGSSSLKLKQLNWTKTSKDGDTSMGRDRFTDLNVGGRRRRPEVILIQHYIDFFVFKT